MKLITWKVMLYPDIHNNEQYLSIDPDGPVPIHDVSIPVYPKLNEVVQFTSLTQTQYMLVKEASGKRV